jgi:Spy/CpxP family protein refolding chaperone
MKKLTMVMLIVAFMATSVSMVSAQRRGGMRGHDEMGHPGGKHPGGGPLLMAPWEHVLDLAEDIQLNDDQLKAIKKARTTLHELNETVIKELETIREQFHELMLQTDASQLDKALKMSDQMNKLKGQIHLNTVKAAFDIKKVLSPDQQEQIREMLREIRKDRKEFRGRGGRGDRDGRMGRKSDHRRDRQNRRHDRDDSPYMDEDTE